MASVSTHISTSSLRLWRTLDSGRPCTSFSLLVPVTAVAPLGSASCPNRRWRRRFENESANIIVSRRYKSDHGVGNRNRFTNYGGVKESIALLRQPPSHLSSQRHRFRSSSSRTDDRQRPPLPIQFLEAHDEKKFDPSTHQRNDVPFDSIDGKPPPPPSSATSEEGETLSKLISWHCSPDGDTSCLATRRKNDSDSRARFSNKWVDDQVERWRANSNDFDCFWSPTGEKSAQETTGTPKRVLWSNWTESMVRDPKCSPILFEYNNLLKSVNDGGTSQRIEEERLLKMLYQYGIVLITGTPTYTDTLPLDVKSEATKNSHKTDTSGGANESAESAILSLASLIGYHPLQTLYGSGVWSTSSSSSFYNNDNGDNENEASSTADSAYGATSLPLHTDMTYMANPPGAQVFLMVQPAASAPSSSKESSPSSASDDVNRPIVPQGQSVYLDGFSAARQLLSERPDAFRLLATTSRRYRCVDDDEGWHLEATGPLIETSVPAGECEWGPVTSIRHNDLDRLPDLPPYSKPGTTGEEGGGDDTFYEKLREAHRAWDDILRRDSMRLVIDLRPGDCVLVANQRCMHGRYAFETSEFPRVVMGCYVGMDELLSKWRKIGLRVL